MQVVEQPYAVALQPVEATADHGQQERRRGDRRSSERRRFERRVVVGPPRLNERRKAERRCTQRRHGERRARASLTWLVNGHRPPATA